MYTLIRTDSSHKDFIKLVRALDAELAIYNGEQDDFYSKYNPVSGLRHTIVLYNDVMPIASGAFKPIVIAS